MMEASFQKVNIQRIYLYFRSKWDNFEDSHSARVSINDWRKKKTICRLMRKIIAMK